VYDIKTALLKDKFRKGTLMRSSTKSRGPRLLMLLAFVMLACTIGFAENGNENSEKKEVLTTLEQRMQKPISVEFRGESIDNVIAMMAKYADVDIIKSPEVEAEVTATLTDVPLEEALGNILAAHGFGYITSKNLIRIVPLEEITERPERLVTRIYRITYADVTEVEAALKKFISRDASLSSNPGTSNIIVTDTESRIKAIDVFIAEIDRITPQILVEARIYDISSTDKLDLGIEWQAGRNTVYNTTSGTGTIGVNPTKSTGGVSSRRDPFMTGVFSGATGKTSGTTGALRVGWLNAAIDVDLLLRAQENKTNAKLLANPRILVLDNESALIKIISEIPYQELTESSEGGSIGTTSFKEVGVELIVTPHLTRDGMIRLQLQPKFSVHVSDVTFVTGDLQYPQPVIDRREAKTTLLIKNGQTVVLGGLRKKDVTQQINKIPLLGDIPLVGALFRFEGEKTINSELVVFITPRLVETPVMSETEHQAYKETEFSGPKPTFTRAEKAEEEAKEKAK